MSESGPAPEEKKPPSRAESVRNRIVAVTGVFLVVPALVNAAYDVYAAALKLPRSENERINVELYKKHFGKNTEREFQIGVKTQYGTVDATFKVFDEGDILVQYGDRSQWFKFPKPELNPPAKVNWVPLPSAFAAGEVSGNVRVEAVTIKGSVGFGGTVSKIAAGDISLKGNILTNALVLGAGSRSSATIQSIDIRSGRISAVGVMSVNNSSIAASLKPRTVVDLGTINVGPGD